MLTGTISTAEDDRGSTPFRLRRRPLPKQQPQQPPSQLKPNFCTQPRPRPRPHQTPAKHVTIASPPTTSQPAQYTTPISSPIPPSPHLASSSTIRLLRVAFQDTPPRLKALEEGWRRARWAQDEVREGTRVASGSSSSTLVKSWGDKWDKSECSRRIDSRPKTGAIMATGQASFPLTPPPTPESVSSSPRIQTRRCSTVPVATPQSTTTLKASHNVAEWKPLNRLGPARTVTSATISRQSPKTASHRLLQQPPSHISNRSTHLHPRPVPDQISAPTPRAILAHPLPPTPVPVALDKRHNETIYVHSPSDAISMTLKLSRGRVVRVDRAGHVVFLARVTSEFEGADDGVETIKLRDFEKWRDKDRHEWAKVQALVELFKRRTPRVKVYTALGDLAISCSHPPDVYLSFSEWSKGARHLTKVRIRWSISMAMAVIDTSTRSQSGYGGKDRCEGAQGKGRSMISASEEGDGNGSSSSSGRGQERARSRRVIPLSSVDVPRALLGVVVGPDWGEWEREAVVRLKLLHGEWAGFVQHAQPA